MDSEIVLRAAEASLSGSLPFPEIVGQLIETGVEFYHVDYLSLQMRFHDGGGSVISAAIILEGLPPVAADFDSAELRAAILDSQQNGQKFRDFSRRAMAAGVHGYFAFLRGKRVTYFGRTGDQHTEWFPGAK
jgi:uncharacterized protein YbcV (DUF1398 family)